MRYKLTIEYDGTNYCGWQIQQNGITVQEVVENALKKIGCNATATASGRTDSGVHAKGQVAHFDGELNIPLNRIPLALNAYLPNDVSVVKCEIVDENFNARFSAKRKTYCYRLYFSRVRHPLIEHNHTHIVVPLDVDKMKEAASVIEGEHDFKCFEAAGAQVKNTVRTIYEIKIENKKSENFEEIEIYVTGNGFLYNMVRIIAGTLMYVGQGKFSIEDVKKIIETGDRTMSGKTLPAKGLTLEKVFYD